MNVWLMGGRKMDFWLWQKIVALMKDKVSCNNEDWKYMIDDNIRKINISVKIKRLIF